LKEKYQNKTIEELDIRKQTGATVIGLKDSKDGFIFDPGGETIINNGEVLIVVGSIENFKKFKVYCN